MIDHFWLRVSWFLWHWGLCILSFGLTLRLLIWVHKKLVLDANPHAKGWMCRFGVHAWNVQSSCCDECRMPDRLLVPERFKEWRRSNG